MPVIFTCPINKATEIYTIEMLCRCLQISLSIIQANDERIGQRIPEDWLPTYVRTNKHIQLANNC